MSAIALAKACHPLPAAAVTALSTALAVGLGYSWTEVGLAALTVGASQLSTGWGNDAIDAGRDQTVARGDKPLVSEPGARGTVAIAAMIAAAVTVAGAFAWGMPAGWWIILALVSAQLYNWPLKATAFSIVPYLVSFGALLLFLRAPVWLALAAALLGGGAHLVNAIPDLAEDKATGIRGLPHRLGERGSLFLATGLLLAATVTLVLGGRPPWWAGVPALLVALVPIPVGMLGKPRSAFRAVILVAAVDVLLLIASGAL